MSASPPAAPAASPAGDDAGPVMPELGIVEGRFGKPWSWTERTEVMTRLAGAGYRFYHYGPKADHNLRHAWRDPHSAETFAALAAFADACHRHGVRFGIALTPADAPFPLDDAARTALRARLRTLAEAGTDDLVILFDDLRGDMPHLAELQADVVHFCATQLPDAHVYFCPTYYSDDTILDRAFGPRPADYLEHLGQRLDPAVRVYWTGEEVCSVAITPGHLRAVADRLGRRVCLWDNYPVNDGPRMSRFLHLRAFTGRSADLAPWITGHAINPAIQPHLTCLPALTLPQVYRQGADYAYGAAFRDVARSLLGDDFAATLERDLYTLCDTGWERIGDHRTALIERYGAFDHPAAAEIVRWLNGDDLMDSLEVKTQ